MKLFGDIYRGKKVLVTGHTGFKGSWLYTLLIRLGAIVEGIALPPPSIPNHYDLCGYTMKEGATDIRDLAAFSKKIQDFQPEIIFHLAAQPLVGISYDQPLYTYETNLMGTVNLYEACKGIESLRAIVNITSDKVYDTAQPMEKYKETDRLGGYDPYSASKACCEIFLHSYIHSYIPQDMYGKTHHVLVGIPRAGNVIGGGDWAAGRLIPDIIRAVGNNRTIQIRYPNSVRPWQHVLDSITAYLLLGKKLLSGDKTAASTFNFGPVETKFQTVMDIIHAAGHFWPGIQVDIDQAPKLHETHLLKLDCTKAQEVLDWHPIWDATEAFKYTFQWYFEFLSTGKINTMHDIDAYVQGAREKGLTWLD